MAYTLQKGHFSGLTNLLNELRPQIIKYKENNLDNVRRKLFKTFLYIFTYIGPTYFFYFSIKGNTKFKHVWTTGRFISCFSNN